MNVIPNGSRVKIKDTNSVATIHACCVAGENTPIIEYRIIYWVGGDRRDAWVYDWEVELYVETKKKAGMVNYETSIVKS